MNNCRHFCRLPKTSSGHTCPEQQVIEHTLLAECDSLFKELATMIATPVKSKNAGNMAKKLWEGQKEEKK